MDFPVCPVDGLPICPDEAASAAALMELIGGAGRWGDESANGSRGAVVGGCGHTSFGLFVCGAVCSDERSVASGGATMSGFSESEGDNADAIDQADGEAQNPGDQGAVIQDRTDSGDGGSAQSTGKVDAQATGWKRGYESGTIRVGNHPPDRAPCPERVGAGAEN